MEVYPEYEGPMVNWPKIGLVPGAGQALQALSDLGLPLFVATNAAASSAAQVRAALARAGVDSFFSEVFTFNELGFRKPEQGFFDSLAQKIDALPSSLLMVGDEYSKDVWGACAAGWRAIWYNPNFTSVPGLLPVECADVHQMADLPKTLPGVDLPTVAECLDWLFQEGASHNLLQHVQTTAAIAYLLALRLRSCGADVDPILAHRGGMLHDLAKIKSVLNPQPGVHHGELGARLLERRNQSLLAEIARRHMLFDILDVHKAPQTWEQKLVFYADKLSESSRLVPLEQRLEALTHRYHIDPSQIEAVRPALISLQDEISAGLGLPVETWFEFLDSAIFKGVDPTSWKC
jgi:putative hydrolase of the HAD superfamily